MAPGVHRVVNVCLDVVSTIVLELSVRCEIPDRLSKPGVFLSSFDFGLAM